MDWIAQHWFGAAVMVAFGRAPHIQISPLKINPWSALGSAVGRVIGVADIRDSLNRHIKQDDERFIKQCRLRILRFNDEILQGKLHTKEHFDEILDDITEYERYCELHPGYKNSKAGMAISNVEAVYQKCLAEKGFL